MVQHEPEYWIRLDDPVIRYIPAFAGDEGATIRHLLSHTSDYGDEDLGGDGNDLGTVEPGKLADLIRGRRPEQDIGDIRRVTTVIKGGRVYVPAEIYRALGIEPCCTR